MGFDASFYLLSANRKANGAIPLGVLGAGGTQAFTWLGGAISGAIRANPYQLGRVTVMGTFGTNPPTVQTATGFDNRMDQGGHVGAGTIQLVAPATVDVLGLGTLGALAIVTVTTPGAPVPEPATALLLGAGLCALAALRRSRSAR
jgi:hypothetical protein